MLRNKTIQLKQISQLLYCLMIVIDWCLYLSVPIFEKAEVSSSVKSDSVHAVSQPVDIFLWFGFTKRTRRIGGK